MFQAQIPIATFSIAAHDRYAGEWGVAVASKFLGVGSVVPWVRANAGAIATQAWANLSYGPDGLALLKKGESAQTVVDTLVAVDEGKEHRQIGVVDLKGGAATFTGSECMTWAGGATADGVAVQGNILTGPEVVDEVLGTFQSSTGRLADRMLAALLAGDRAGGDSRGRQSAAVYVARDKGSYGGYLDRTIDLRVDDHTDPVPELQRLLGIHKMLFDAPSAGDAVEIDDELGLEIASMLKGLAFDAGIAFDEKTQIALASFIGVENLEMRTVEGSRIDPLVLEHLRMKSKAG